MITFTRRYEDKSNNYGFQFQFHCDRSTWPSSFCRWKECSTSFLSTYQANPVGIASTLTQAASYLIGKGYGIGHAGHLINNVYKSQAWQDAYAKAIEEVKPHFKQCTRCAAWVCADNCWNDRRALCTTCAPELGNEVASANAQAAKEQIFKRARDTDQISHVDTGTDQVASCPHCGERSAGGKFCVGCGKEFVSPSFCASCGKKVTSGANSKFCQHCGDRL